MRALCFILFICSVSTDPSIRGTDLINDDVFMIYEDHVPIPGKSVPVSHNSVPISEDAVPSSIDDVFGLGEASQLRTSESGDACGAQIPTRTDKMDKRELDDQENEDENEVLENKRFIIDDGDSKDDDELKELGQIWMFDGFTFIDRGIRHPVPSVMGIVKLTSHKKDLVEGQFTLANEMNFKLIRQPDLSNSPNSDSDAPKFQEVVSSSDSQKKSSCLWRVELVNRTNIIGTPEDILFEDIILKSFLSDGSNIQIDVIPTLHFSRIVISTKDENPSSLQLLPLPFLFSPLSASQTIEGEWEVSIGSNLALNDEMDHGLDDGMDSIALDEKTLSVVLSITRISRELYLMGIEGLNVHQALMKMNEKEEVIIDTISSTSLTPDDERLGKIESDLISAISLSSHLKIENKSLDNNSDLIPTLIFSNPNYQNSDTIKFIRPKFSDRDHHFRQLQMSQWLWMPESLILHTPNSRPVTDMKRWESAAQLSVPVRMDIRRFGHAVMLDMFIGEKSHIRAVQLPTTTSSQKSVRTVTDLSESRESDNAGQRSTEEVEVSELIEMLLNQFELIDPDVSGGFVTVLGPEVSLSFSAAPIPSPGLWVLDTRFSQINGSSIESIHNDERVSMLLTKDGDRLKGSMSGDVVTIDFSIVDVNPIHGEFDWRVQQLAARRVPKFYHEKSGVETLDHLVSRFFHDGIKVEVGRGLDVAGVIFSNDDSSDAIVFLHPLDLTVALLGDWRLVSGTINGEQLPTSKHEDESTQLRLRAGGVGELYGKLRSGSIFSVHMKEVLSSAESTKSQSLIIGEEKISLTPALWSFDVHRLSRKSFRGEFALDEGTGRDRVVELMTHCGDMFVEAGVTRLNLKCEYGEVEFIKVLEKRISHLITGNWTVEFVGTESLAEDLRAPEVLGAIAVYHSDGSGLQVHLEKIDEAFIETTDKSGAKDEAWSSGSVESYKASVSRVLGHQVIAEFKLFVNPFGGVKVAGVELNEVENAES